MKIVRNMMHCNVAVIPALVTNTGFLVVLLSHNVGSDAIMCGSDVTNNFHRHLSCRTSSRSLQLLAIGYLAPNNIYMLWRLQLHKWTPIDTVSLYC